MAMIRIADLHKAFGPKRVLQGVNLEIDRGETMVIIGQSGSGKSVLLKHLIGMMKPDQGRILIEDVDITALKPEALQKILRRFGMLFQGAALFDSMTVAENVSFGLKRYTNYPRQEITGIVRESLARVGLQ